MEYQVRGSSMDQGPLARPMHCLCSKRTGRLVKVTTAGQEEDDMTTTQRLSLAALLFAPLLATAAPAGDAVAKSTEEVSRAPAAASCSCHAKKLTASKEGPAVADWVRELWTSP